MTATRCAGCRAELPPSSRYCSVCGKATLAHARAARAELASTRRRVGRAGLAIAIGFVVPTVLPLLRLSGVELDEAALIEGFDAEAALAQALALVLGTLGILLVLGDGALRDTLRVKAPWQAWCAVPVVAAASWSAATLWVRAVDALREASDGSVQELKLAPTTLPELVVVIAIAPLLEELLCRGALWTALSRIGRDAQTLATSAMVFALLHALNGGFFLELPHRFVAGLAFGWLRLRSGSIATPVLAHALHNAAATAWSD